MTEQPPRRTGPRPRARPRPFAGSLRELPFLLVLGGIALGLAVVGLHHFKRGSMLIGAALVVGGILRLALSERRAGLLVVRGRALDAVTMIGLGILIGVAAAIVPGP